MKKILKEVFDNLEGNGIGIGTSDFWDIGGQAGKYNSAGRSQITKNMVQALAKTLINSDENIEIQKMKVHELKPTPIKNVLFQRDRYLFVPKL